MSQFSPSRPDPYAPFPGSAPAKPRASTVNGWGIAGFVVSLVGLLFTCGLLCPVGVLLSLVGLLRSPRGFAVTGLLLGLLGLAPIAGVVYLVRLGHQAAQEARARLELLQEEAETHARLEQAAFRIEQEVRERGSLPEGIEGNKLVLEHHDAWGESLRYDREGDAYRIRSAGPDQQFDTPDDLLTGLMSPTVPAPVPGEAPDESALPPDAALPPDVALPPDAALPPEAPEPDAAESAPAEPPASPEL